MPHQSEAVILMGIQATGKSTFFRERFFRTHVRINLDMLKTRQRELILLNACLEMNQSFVVDNTNPSRRDRSRYLAPARAAGFRITGYFFESRIAEALVRNETRTGPERIPPQGVRNTRNRLEMPSLAEGFDDLFFVRLDAPQSFEVTRWNDEI
ncbi:MAG: AAA family ATPase [Blastocatellia bacterium]|nr:AAA family ATPase [Blastocatellia bacterium]